ncbi:30S ribosomal protein S17 [Candidatus Woesearchaeota archaeon]|nr:30S ribosomal protein S17 [Candidatus Woesearchaeota archaeon]
MAKTVTKSIGIKVQPPKESCTDKKCPFHGSLKVRGQSFTGVVVAADVHKSATVEWGRRIFIPKYERYEKRRSRIRVHNPSCIAAKIGDLVRIHECRPLSKTKHFVVVQKIGQDILFAQKQELKAEGKVKQAVKGFPGEEKEGEA